MSKNKLKKIVKLVTPPIVLSLLQKLYSKIIKGDKSVRGMQYLDFAKEFIASTGGISEGFEKRVIQSIKSTNNNHIIIHADLMDAFMPNYEKNLFQYYQYQQYDLLFRFLQYPFMSSSLIYYTHPYDKAIGLLDEIHVVDYGCGIPFGLIETLISKPMKVKSATLIDLDLVHMDFVSFIIKKISPDLSLTVHRLKDTKMFPPLKNSYNLFIGKDIFEHLHNPEKNLRKLISHSANESICFFDFANHGVVKYQHISPNIAFLSNIMEEYGYKKNEVVMGLSMFTKTTSGSKMIGEVKQ